MAKWPELAILALISVLLPTEVLCLDGYWQGSALFRGQWRFMEAEFSENLHVPSKIDLPQQRHELKDFKKENGALEFTLVRGSSELKCTGTLRGDSIVGVIQIQTSRGAFQLRKIGDRQFQRLSDVLGSYRPATAESFLSRSSDSGMASNGLRSLTRRWVFGGCCCTKLAIALNSCLPGTLPIQHRWKWSS
jgi:hypothetical protein